MHIILAGPRGFCAGVNVAIESLDVALERFGSPVYVYHEIVHNRWVVEHFCRRGVVFVDDLCEVPNGSHLLYSAHGVAPKIRREAELRRLKTIDATCPLVTKVHRKAIRYAKAGYRIILIGHEGHDEVVGTMGEAPDAITLVGNVDDVNQLTVPDDRKMICLTQTTLSVGDAARITRRLEQRFPAIERPPKEDICFATQNRQDAVGQLSREADMALVVGSQNSSNSQRLAELAQESGVPTHLIDGRDDIRPDWFKGPETVLITAGASAPETVVQECVEFLKQRYGAEVESRTIREEQIRFILPKELR